MKNRIKVLYLLTIAVIIAFICAEGYWLNERFRTTTAVTQFDIYVRVAKMFKEDCERCEGKFDEFSLDTDSMAQAIGKAFDVRSVVVRVEKTDSVVQTSNVLLSTTLLNPKMKVIYPYNPLDKEVAVAEIPVPLDATFKKMANTLLLAFILSLLLVFCLVYQITTIRQQQKVAEIRKSFTLTMIHELKRPLGALKLFISFMKNERLDAADREAALANGAREIENLSSYFNKLRVITYNEASEVPLSLSSFKLKDAVEESVAMISGACVSVEGEDVEIVAERQSIVNVLCNLIENAVKYSTENNEICVAWETTDGSLEISVADRGRGIPDADKPLIFDQFYRAGKSANIPGMGLGLAYVRQVVEAHGGTIAVKDRDGGGTVFTINLPQ